MNHTGCNLREALILAAQFGCEIHHVNRTGEVRVLYLPGRRSVRLNARRKDAPRALTTLLNQIQRGLL